MLYKPYNRISPKNANVKLAKLVAFFPADADKELP